jgi:hypothetical protein
MIFPPLSEVVQSIIEEYKAAEKPDYVNYGQMGVTPSVPPTPASK